MLEKRLQIKVSPDESLIGSKVYRYTPAGGESVVAVKRITDINSSGSLYLKATTTIRMRML